MLVALGLSSCLLVSTPAAGQEASPEASPTNPPPLALSHDGRRTMGRLPGNLLRGSVGMFGRDGLSPVVIGAAATSLGALYDNQVENQIADPSNQLARSLENIAAGIPSGLAVAGVFAAGRLSHNQRFRDVGYDLLGASLVNGLWTTALKHAIQRPRPDGSDKLSFPSGHASNAFTLATVVDLHYGWKASLSMYALASTVAISRVQRNKHHLSDVLAGATLGYVVGRTVVRVNSRPPDLTRSPQLSASPVLGPHTRALSFRLTF